MSNWKKNIISSIVSLCLGVALVGSVPIIGIAEDAPVIVRNLSVKFMGVGAAPENEGKDKAKLNAEDVGKKFWIGVAVDKVNDLPLFTDGVYSVELAFEYNVNFLEPYDWSTGLAVGNMKTGTNDAMWWNSDQYEIISVDTTDIDVLSDRENIADAQTRKANGWKMCTVCITLKDGASKDGMRFKDLAVVDNQYLAKLPFKLKQVPQESDIDQNPTVLSLVRGPLTFDIGSGSDGVSPYSSWKATVDDSTDQTNLKNLFTFKGDISLFGNGSELEDMVVAKSNLEAGEEETIYELSTTKDLNKDGFKAESNEYYISVPNETESIKLSLTSSEMPTVQGNGTNVTATLKSDKLYETDPIVLNDLDKNVEVDGYNNSITVTVGSTTYTVNIRKLLKPKIVLNPGNSPYGEIMKADNIANADKQAAKDAFANSNSINKQYGNGFIPDGVSNIPYSVTAWTDVNYDMVEEAIFVYQEKKFKDPGFVIYDELGELVENAVVDREIAFNTLINTGIPKYGITETEDASYVSEYVVKIQDKTSDYIFDDLQNKMIRPEVYKLKYTYDYIDLSSGQNKNITTERPVVVISQRGDIQFTIPSGINYNDSSYFTSNWGSIEKLTAEGGKIYAFRIADTELTLPPGINFNDTSYLKNHWGENGYFKPFYIALPEE